jgi:hypothetical protein
MDEMDEFLNGDAPEVVEQAEAVEVEAETPAPKPEPARGPDGKFAPKGETDAPPASTEPFEGKATLDERKRRQAAEARATELERRIQELSAPLEQPADMFENPEGWQNQFGAQVTSQAALNARLDTSEMLAAQAHADFEEMRPKILALIEANPSLRQQVLADRHPWNKAYSLAKNIAQAEQLGATDVDGLRAAIRAEVEAELAAKAPAPVAIPNSLSTAQGGLAAATDLGGPASLESILGIK